MILYRVLLCIIKHFIGPRDKWYDVTSTCRIYVYASTSKHKTRTPAIYRAIKILCYKDIGIDNIEEVNTKYVWSLRIYCIIIYARGVDNKWSRCCEYFSGKKSDTELRTSRAVKKYVILSVISYVRRKTNVFDWGENILYIYIFRNSMEIFEFVGRQIDICDYIYIQSRIYNNSCVILYFFRVKLFSKSVFFFFFKSLLKIDAFAMTAKHNIIICREK